MDLCVKSAGMGQRMGQIVWSLVEPSFWPHASVPSSPGPLGEAGACGSVGKAWVSGAIATSLLSTPEKKSLDDVKEIKFDDNFSSLRQLGPSHWTPANAG